MFYTVYQKKMYNKWHMGKERYVFTNPEQKLMFQNIYHYPNFIQNYLA